MNIPKKIAELRQMLIVHQTEMGYHIFDEVLMILAWLNKRVNDNSTECFSLVERINKAWPDPPQEELKPCPFCGCTEIQNHGDERHVFWFFCVDCGAQVGDKFMIDMARQKWNRRSNA